MKEGTLKLRDGRTASAGPDGWHSDEEGLADLLDRAFPPPPTEAGTPWVIAFRRAADALGAKVTAEPEPDDWPGVKAGTGDDEDAPDAGKGPADAPADREPA